MGLKHLTIAFCLVFILMKELNCENIDNNDFERFCYPAAHQNTRKSCECSNESDPPWGLRALHIDCSFKYLRTEDLSEALPLYANTLDMSWNSLDKLPQFACDSLKQLNLIHNNISVVVSKNFIKLPKLRQLYLSWNSIQVIEPNAFEGLGSLQILDLSHNNLHALSSQMFLPMLLLENLNLSWNRLLNQTVGIQELEFYQTFGISPKLRILKLEACGLANIILPEKAPLVELNLRRNRFKRIPETLPSDLQKLDVSENLLTSLLPADTKNLTKLNELLLEDMPLLETIEENSLVPMQSLQEISFQNCRRLKSFHAYAFGVNTTKHPQLKSMIFRGSTLRSFNSTLSPIFNQLTDLDLKGMPLYCYCELNWVKDLPMETHGRCFKPSRLRGLSLTKARASDFSCSYWPQWISGLIILCLIILCAGGIYLIVMCLRPHRGSVTMRRKVGAGSPYARVTIEPNRQENNQF
ncbi:leucine-rich repeat neuronal protein 2 [Teleopsis dalmanni]|uniref:leucine-rich repeat neuronal protein 2 n=1 Tax=Teleopsis dalmanni TaxID=139649 RepID=UPI0018CC8CAA|nr:leucine-rich repeat neuronal protein 2 [Teleopsis dalmanni]